MLITIKNKQKPSNNTKLKKKTSTKMLGKVFYIFTQTKQ